jgi:hypothetical protein
MLTKVSIHGFLLPCAPDDSDAFATIAQQAAVSLAEKPRTTHHRGHEAADKREVDALPAKANWACGPLRLSLTSRVQRHSITA